MEGLGKVNRRNSASGSTLRQFVATATAVPERGTEKPVERAAAPA
jgi:hypothetical protein